MADTIRLSSVEGAGNWWRSLTWAGEALTNGGLQIEMTRYGIGASEPLLRVATGEADLACTLSVAAAQAAKGLGLHKNGEATSIRGLAHLIRPNQHYFNMIRADVGIRSLAEIAEKKPKLDMSIGEKEYVSGQIPEVYMRHYGVELFRDIEAWGGSFQTSHPNTIPLIAQGKSNSLMREDTAAGPAGVAAQLFPFVLLPLDEDIADLIEREDIRPAPYVGRYKWVMLDRLDAVGWPELQELIRQSYEMVAAKAPKKERKAKKKKKKVQKPSRGR